MSYRKEIKALYANGDTDGLIEKTRERPSRVLNYLTGRLFAADPSEKFKAVHTLGVVVSDESVVSEDRLLNLLRRFFWALNDESGAVPFGIAEGIGEILVRRPEFQRQFLPNLASFLCEEELEQTGRIEQGLVWALGRIGTPVASLSPASVDVLSQFAAQHDSDETRLLAAEALKNITAPQGP